MSRLWAVPDQYKSLLQLSHSMITFDAALSTTKLEAAEHDLGFVGANRNDGMAGAAGNARAGDDASA